MDTLSWPARAPKIIRQRSATCCGVPYDDSHFASCVRSAGSNWIAMLVFGMSEIIATTGNAVKLFKGHYTSKFGTSATVERIGRDSIVVKRCDGDYGFCGKSIKLFFDLESKKALGSVEFLPVEVSQFVVKDDGFYSIAEPEGHGYIIARYDSGRPRLLTGAEKDAVLTALTVPEPPKYRPDRRSFLKSGPLDPSLNPDVQPDDYVEISPKSGFWLSRGAGVQQVGVEGVVERTLRGYYLYAMPQSTPDDIFQRRPKLRGRIIEQGQV